MSLFASHFHHLLAMYMGSPMRIYVCLDCEFVHGSNRTNGISCPSHPLKWRFDRNEKQVFKYNLMVFGACCHDMSI